MPRPNKKAVPQVEITKPVRKRLSRKELAPNARKEIFNAAAKVVGEYGYANASITRITQAAGIAQGTFYLYFASRQALFDELLPHVGVDMMHYLRGRLAGAKDLYDMEERGFRGFFKYCEMTPWFFRVLNEAEVAAPVAFRKHFESLTQHYVKALERSIANKEIRNFERDELETIVYMLMAARSFLNQRLAKKGLRKLPEKVVKTYMTLVRSGLN